MSLLNVGGGHDFFVLPDLNMRSMRSVIRNPPTMLLNEAATAIDSQHGGERGFVPPGDDDGGDHHDGVQRVGERHQRRMQQRRDALDHFKSDEAGENEYKKIGDEVRRHSSS